MLMPAPSAAAPIPVIIDTDPGVDDAIALLMALACPMLDILGITAVGGNVPLARATRNALALLEHAGRTDIPVLRGASRPLQGRFPYAREVHSPAGLTRRLPNPTVKPAEANAVQFLGDALAASPGAITIIALGPLSNLARLLRRQPAAYRGVRSIVVMGGGISCAGNVTPFAEFNFYSDPTAARLVMESGVPITLVDLAACRQVYLTRTELAGITAGSPEGRLAAELLDGWFRNDPSRERFNLYDPLAVAAAIDPEILHTRRVALTVADADTDADASLWGECRIVDGTDGTVAVADVAADGNGGVDRGRARSSIRNLLCWQ